MKFRTFRGTTLKVSEIGLDLAAVSSPSWKRMSESDMAALLLAAFDQGVTLYDTDEACARGRGEELLARAFPKRLRDEVVIAAKAGHDIYNLGAALFGAKNPPLNFRPDFIRHSAEQSLRRLRTDRIDLFQLHHPRREHLEDGAVWEELARLRQEGKILHFGVCLGPGLGWLYEGVDCIQRRAPAAVEHDMSVIDPHPGGFIHAAAYARLPHPGAAAEDLPEYRHGRMEIEPQLPTGFLIRHPLSHGLLGGKWTTETLFAPGDPRADKPRAWLAHGLRKARELEFLRGKETGRTLAQASLLWLLAEKTVVSCLVQPEDRAALGEFVAAPEKNPLESGELERARQLAEDNFGVKEGEPEFAGTMRREA